MWETLRRHDTPAARRSEIASQILKKIDGRVAELANSHSSSRVVQAVVKHGTAAEREKVLKQLEPTLVTLSKSPYGRFVVSKLIDLASKDDLEGKLLDLYLDFYISPLLSFAASPAFLFYLS